ncbi:MAG: bglA [Cyanobacteria bacterium RYN_339]|nr:bglA [Cyanobacteria bacterium RYN_339]
MFARRLALAALALATAACAHLPVSSPAQRPLGALAAKDVGAMPAGFLWGVATAGFQTEGGDTSSNWAAWTRAGHTKAPMGRATDAWNRYQEDLDLAKGIGLNSFRLSLEWARLEPRPGQWDMNAVQHYHDVLLAARSRGLEPIVTVSHFAYPAWLDTIDPTVTSAWESPKMAGQLARFAGFVAKEYGPQVKWWITLNEPNTLGICGYLAGQHAPGKHNPFVFRQVMDHQVDAHMAAYDAIHAADPDAMVSVNPIVLMRRPDSPVYKTKGVEDDLLPLDENAFLDRVDPPWVDGHAPDPTLGRRTLDYVAYNYFYAPNNLDAYKLADYLNWPIYPQGIYVAARRLWDRHHLPLMVTENGLALENGRTRPDGWTREAFLVNHVAQLQRATREGIPLLGYMHWTLTDNYEWGSFQPRFGLFSVDPDDLALKRVRTPAADVYDGIARANGVPKPLLDRYLGFKN